MGAFELARGRDRVPTLLGSAGEETAAELLVRPSLHSRAVPLRLPDAAIHRLNTRLQPASTD